MKCSYCGKQSSNMMKTNENTFFCNIDCLNAYYAKSEKKQKNIERGKKAKSNGDIFEDIIIKECEKLQIENIAVIRKLNEERIGNKNPNNPHAYTSQLWCDFIGYYNDEIFVDFPDVCAKCASFIAFECKSTDSDYFPFSNIAPHQIEFLHKLNQDEGYGFLLIYFANRDKNNVIKWYINESTYIMLSKLKKEKLVKGKAKEVYTKGINYNDLIKIVDKDNIMNIYSLEIL